MSIASRTGIVVLIIASCTASSSAQTGDPPIDDERLSIHTLIREDVFSAWRSDNMKRLERGEANIERLLEKRPEARADLLAWKGGAMLYRAAVANDKGQADEYSSRLKQAREMFAEAKKVNPRSAGVYAVIGGSNAMFADRLAKEDRAAAWEQAYGGYQWLWEKQEPHIDRMPLHIGGELLSGLAQSSQRTGRTKQVDKYLDKIIELYDDSGYAKEAKAWKMNPEVAAGRNITCKSCHSAGRLKATLTRLNDK